MQSEWVKICQILAENLQDGKYSVWIAPLKAVQEEETLIVAGMNDFVADFVRGHFAVALKDAAMTVLGYIPKLEILPIAAVRPDLQVKLQAAPAVPFGGKIQIPTVSCLIDEEIASLEIVSTTSSNLSPDAFSYCGALTAINPALVASVLPEPQPLYSSQPMPAISGPSASYSSLQATLPVRWSEASSLPRNWRYSFDDFVVGPCNELAYAAARGLCRYEGFGARSSGVLYLCSQPGLGKTHLMQAVGQGLCKVCNVSSPRVEYLTAEEFTTRLRMSLKSGDVDSFKARYRDTDVLLLEDVHFMQEKDKMQGELLATVNALLDRGSRVVFSSSFSPRELHGMDGQLLSRLSSGFIAAIDRPDHATRKKIIEQKASLHQVLLPEDITEFLASHIHEDVRQIESCLENLILKAQLMNCRINMQMARDTIGNYLSATPALDFESIISQICAGFALLPEELNSKSRKKELVLARNAVFYLARKHTALSLNDIGTRFSRNHSTVIKGITALEREMSRQTPIGRQLGNVIALVERNSTAALPF